MLRRESTATLWVVAAAVALSVAGAMVAVAGGKFRRTPPTVVVPPAPPLASPLASPAAAPAPRLDPTGWLREHDLGELGISYRYPNDGKRYERHQGVETIYRDSRQWETRTFTFSEINQPLPDDQIFQALTVTPWQAAYPGTWEFPPTTFNLGAPDEELQASLRQQFGSIGGWKRTTLGGRPAVSFVRVKRWTTAGVKTLVWIAPSVFAPGAAERYPHLFITGPTLLKRELPPDVGAAEKTVGEELLAEWERSPQPTDPARQQRYQLFLAMLETLEFNADAPPKTPPRTLESLGIRLAFPAEERSQVLGSLCGWTGMKTVGRSLYYYDEGEATVVAILAAPAAGPHAIGCGYGGPLLDLTQSDDQIAAEITRTMGPIARLVRTTVGGRPAVAFFHTEYNYRENQLQVWVKRSYLVPYQRAEFTNLLVTGPALVTETADFSELATKRAELAADFSDRLPQLPLEVRRRLSTFEATVRTITFTKP